MTIKPPQHVQYRTYSSPVYAVCSSDGWASSTVHEPTVFRPLNPCKGPEAMNVLPACHHSRCFWERRKAAWSLRREPSSLQASVCCLNVGPLIGRISDRHDTRGQLWHTWDDCQLSGLFRRKFTSELRLLVLLLVNSKDTIGVLCERWLSVVMRSYKIELQTARVSLSTRNSSRSPKQFWNAKVFNVL